MKNGLEFAHINPVVKWLRTKFSLALLAVAMLITGFGMIGVAYSAQYHAPQPSESAAGHINPYRTGVVSSSKFYALDGATAQDSLQSTVGPVLPKSDPVSISIPAIKVKSKLQYLGLNRNGTIQVPSPGPKYGEAAWYKYSPTPGEVGPSVIEGHIDSAADGPSVFFYLGALKPGNRIYVTLRDGTKAVFAVTAVRQYPKTSFPTATVYGNTNFAALRLISCSGVFDHATKQYLSDTVVFAELTSSQPSQ